MRLFVGNDRDRTHELIRNLEKVAKIAILRIEKGDTQSVLIDLEWIEDNFITLLKLREVKFKKFKRLIDPDDRYRKVSFEKIDWSTVDFSKVKVVQLHEQKEINQLYQKRYRTLKASNKNEVIPKYIDVIFTIWNKASEEKNFQVQRYCTYILANWIGVLDRITDIKIDFKLIVRFFLENLANLNKSLLQTKDELNPLFSFLSFNIYLEKIFDDDLNESNSDLYFEFLHRNLHYAVAVNRYEVINQFISRTIDSSFHPGIRFGAYSELYELLRIQLDARPDKTVTTESLLYRVTELGFEKLRYNRDEDEYQKWLKDFEAYVESFRPHIIFNNEVKRKIEEIKSLGYRVLNYNRLQITVIKVLVYVLFKDTEQSKPLIRHAFNYNQPGDSNASWSNREILPVSLIEILNYLTYEYSIESGLMIYWEGHHGIQRYLERFFLLLFYHYKPQQRYHIENAQAETKRFCARNLNNSSESINNLKRQVEDLYKRLENEKVAKSGFFCSYLENEPKVASAMSLLKSIANACGAQLTAIVETSAISAQTKRKFFENCIERYSEANFIFRLFERFNEANSTLPESHRFVNPGINKLFDRTPFIENWHVPYIGLIDEGLVIAENENNLGLGAIRSLAKDQTKPIQEHEIAEAIRKVKVKGVKIVIGSNIHFESILDGEKDFIPEDVQHEPLGVKDFYVGKLGNALVYNLYERMFGNQLMMVVSADFLNGVFVKEVSTGFNKIGDFGCRFVDFASDQAELAKLLDNPPQWLKTEIGARADQEAFLKRKVWIQIEKGVFFDVKPGKQGQFFQVNS